MKRLTSLFICIAIIACTVVPVSATSSHLSDIKMHDIITGEYDTGDILAVTPDNIDAIADTQALASFVETGGILLFTNNGNHVPHLTSAFTLPDENENSESASSTDSTDDATANTTPDPGKDIAILYYTYGENKVDGTYIINVGSDDTSDHSDSIDEAIRIIRDRQESGSLSRNSVAVDDSRAETLETFDITTIRLPKAKIMVQYEISTLQDYLGEDYYFVSSIVDAIPGCELSEHDDRFEKRYEGEFLTTSMESNSKTIPIHHYEPTRDTETGSSGFSISLDIGLPKIVLNGISVTFNTTTDFSDCTIDVGGDTNLKEWDVTLTRDAQKTQCTFVYGAVFKCNEGLSHIDIDLYNMYDVDAWNTSPEEIIAERSIRCTPDGVDEL